MDRKLALLRRYEDKADRAAVENALALCGLTHPQKQMPEELEILTLIRMDRFEVHIVVQACIHYIDGDQCRNGKGESYLLGAIHAMEAKKPPIDVMKHIRRHRQELSKLKKKVVEQQETINHLSLALEGVCRAMGIKSGGCGHALVYNKKTR